MGQRGVESQGGILGVVKGRAQKISDWLEAGCEKMERQDNSQGFWSEQDL